MLQQRRTRHASNRLAFLAVCFGLSTGLAWAAAPKQPKSALDLKEFFKPELYISSSNVSLEAALPQLPNRTQWEAFLARRGEDAGDPITKVFIDPRSGAVTNLLDAVPLIPGRGVGNALTLADLSRQLGRPVRKVDGAVVESLLRAHVSARRELLGIDLSQLGPARVTKINDDLWQVSIPQRYQGVVVRDARLAATLNHGNLILLGTEIWGNVRGLDAAPRLSAAQALDTGFAYADGRFPEDILVRAPKLEIVPYASREFQDGDGFGEPLGRGYGHRLVWSFVFQRAPEHARWEVLVDAHDGEVLAFQDKNQYVAKTFKGGVYPLTNTGVCPNVDQCGTMQSNWPMPFADTGFANPNNFTNSGGVYNYTSGTATTTLTGKYVNIADTCGAINNSSPTGDINLGGANNQHNCTSGGGSPGNTAASRSGFYEVNKLAEMARGYLPGNAWLNAQLTSNMNLNDTCNAFWDGSTINFYKSGGGCRNTGEIAAVFDHEWGHGMDQNDGGPFSNSSEGYADIASIYRLEASCVGHGFFESINQGCGMTADGTGFNNQEAQIAPSHCDTDCSGVRDADWAKHNPAGADTALGFVCNQCGGGGGPCGAQVHCSATPVRQMAWDLVTRDLTAPPFNMSSQTAFVTGNRLFYFGSGNVGQWHACSCGGGTSDGCGATNGYMQWIGADDDDGTLNNGTPHMTAIHAAYNRHGIACGTPTPQNSGCAGGPTAASTLTATPGDNSVGLSWTSVVGATGYWVYRSEGHAGCNFGKTRIADVAGLSFSDPNVANGREYYYNVVAHGSSQACFGPVSNCATVTPVLPDFTLSCNPATLTIPQGEDDTSTCTVGSTFAFNSPVTLSCTGLPGGASCSYNPNPVTPPPNGNVNSTLTVSVGGVNVGSYPFQAQGVSGPLSHAFNMTLNVSPGELIVNGGFETSAAPWVFAGPGALYLSNGPLPHGGTGYAQLGGGNNRVGYVYQQVVIPTSSLGNLTFWLNVTSSETSATAQNDKLTVEVRNPAGVLLGTIGTFSNLDKTNPGNYSQKALSMAAFKGQTVRLVFRVATNPSLPTTFRVDDVSLQ